jgi:hypothetical protein
MGTSKATAEILSCPFCGGSNVSTFGPYGWYRQWGISHSCKSFYSGTSEMIQGFPNEAEAIAAWNTRHNFEAPAMEVAIKELVEFCDDPNGSENWETLALGLARMLPNMRAILARIDGDEKC